MKIYIDWQALLIELRRRRLSDREITALLAREGVNVHLGTVRYLRCTPGHIPRYHMGAALLKIRDSGAQGKSYQGRMPVDQIRALQAQGWTQKRIAQHLGIGLATVSRRLNENHSGGATAARMERSER